MLEKKRLMEQKIRNKKDKLYEQAKRSEQVLRKGNSFSKEIK